MLFLPLSSELIAYKLALHVLENNESFALYLTYSFIFILSYFRSVPFFPTVCLQCFPFGLFNICFIYFAAKTGSVLFAFAVAVT